MIDTSTMPFFLPYRGHQTNISLLQATDTRFFHLVIQLVCVGVGLIYSSSIVDLAHVHQLLAPADGYLLGVGLVGQRLVRRLDRVHGVLGSGHASSDVMDTGGAAHLENTVRAAKSKSWEGGG